MPIASNALVFAPQKNTHGKVDADEFLREAHRFCVAVGARKEVVLFDNGEPEYERREHVYQVLDARPRRSLDVLAFFCHGWPEGIQAGFSLLNVRKLALCLKTTLRPDARVLLYCCSAGADNDDTTADERSPGPGGDGGFADKLRDMLGEVSMRATVYAHTVRGHTTMNEYVRVFHPGTTLGGEWVVDPGSPLFSAWRRKLDARVRRGDRMVMDEANTFRFRFPFLTKDELEAELRGEPS